MIPMKIDLPNLPTDPPSTGPAYLVNRIERLTQKVDALHLELIVLGWFIVTNFAVTFFLLFVWLLQ